MTPAQVRLAGELLDLHARQQAELVNLAHAGLAVWVDGRVYTRAGGSDPGEENSDDETTAAVRGTLFARATTALSLTGEELRALGVEVPKLAGEVAGALAKMKYTVVDGPVVSLAGAEHGQVWSTGNDRIPGGMDGAAPARAADVMIEPAPAPASDLDDEIPF